MWNTTMTKVIPADFGDAEWDKAETAARKKTGFTEGVKRKNNLLIAATLEELASQGKESASLNRLNDHIIEYATTMLM